MSDLLDGLDDPLATASVDESSKNVAAMLGLLMNASVAFSEPTQFSVVDAIFVRESKIVAIAETRTRRQFDLKYLRKNGDALLVDQARIAEMCRMARVLAVPALIVSMLGDQTCWFWKIALPDGRMAGNWDSKPVTRVENGRPAGSMITKVPMSEGRWFASSPETPSDTKKLLAQYQEFVKRA
jgi:hypothetical protein